MKLNEFIKNALKEDIGEGDHTSLACIGESECGKAQLYIKEDCILAGVELAQQIFNQIDSNIKTEIFLIDGEKVKKGDIAFIVMGRSRSILQAERLVLNCMQRMSGVATTTHNMVSIIKGLNTKILDTRKTTPGFRMLEKWAVKIGGAENHRFGLYDMIMIKDNHIDFAGGIKQAIDSVQSYLNKTDKNLKITIEARNIKEVKEIIFTGRIDRIMLDNFSIKNIYDAIILIDGKFETEATGGITSKNIREYALSGVDYISIGAITHSTKYIDLSLKAMV